MRSGKALITNPKRMQSSRKWRELACHCAGVLGLCAVVLFCAPKLAAQRTAVEKNGVGGRIETDYDAAGKATEMRTIGADGKVQQKVNYEYPPGYYAPQQTDTTFWPNGNVRKVSRHTYDESGNFTGESVEEFDEAGKQTSGHKLTHDPKRGTYRCAEWKAAARDYRSVACPAGEEESGGGGGGEPPKKFTYDEVMKHLDAARKEQARERTGAALSAGKDVGVVLPARVHRGERISGIVVENPEQYDGLEEVTVTRIRLPLEGAGEGSRLAGWKFEAPGEEGRRADGRVTLVVPAEGSLTITLRRSAAQSVSKTLNFLQALPRRSSAWKTTTHAFEAPALCMKGELCAVSGAFGGDSSKTLAAFEDEAATVVAETAETAYIGIPEATQAGPRPLFLSEGDGDAVRVVAFPLAVGQLSIQNNGREVQAGETVIAIPVLEGPSGLADAVWEIRDSSRSKMERAGRLIPGFRLNGELCEAHETEVRVEQEREAKESDEENEHEAESREEKEDEGKILLVLKNLAPNETSLHGSHNETVAFCLGDEAFQRGNFKYDLRVDARKAGKIAVKGTVIPFLAPVAGQELRIKAEP